MSEGTRVLIVEDNELNRDMLGRRLQKRGYQLIMAEDGLIGVEKAIQELPDIILMDINLPGIDGLEAVRRIRANDSSKSIPIIGLSANARLEDRDHSIEKGCDEYECKPVELERLIQKMQKLLKK